MDCEATGFEEDRVARPIVRGGQMRGNTHRMEEAPRSAKLSSLVAVDAAFPRARRDLERAGGKSCGHWCVGPFQRQPLVLADFNRDLFDVGVRKIAVDTGLTLGAFSLIAAPFSRLGLPFLPQGGGFVGLGFIALAWLVVLAREMRLLTAGRDSVAMLASPLLPFGLPLGDAVACADHYRLAGGDFSCLLLHVGQFVRQEARSLFCLGCVL